MPQLDVIIFPIAEMADLIAARWLAKHEEPATGARKELGRHGAP
jgi:hypothetical protein